MTHPNDTVRDWTADPRFGTDDHPVGTLRDLEALCRQRFAEIVGPPGPEFVGQLFRYERETHRYGALTDTWDDEQAWRIDGQDLTEAENAVLGPDWADDVEDVSFFQWEAGKQAAEAHPWCLLPDNAVALPDLLDERDDQPEYRITDLWSSGGKVVLSAPAKAGKTTLLGNLHRSVVDGDPFLGRFDVLPIEPDERIALFDLELSRAQLRRWLRDQGIRNTDRVHVELYAGRAADLDVRDLAVRAVLARRLRALNVRVLIVDPLAPILAALGINDQANGPVRGYLDALAALAIEAGNLDLLVAHHTGHDGERSRGASAFRDWPDAEWRLTIDRAGGRFFAATGRDVHVAEARLDYDPARRRLTLGDGDRATATTDRNAATVLGLVEANPGATRNDLVGRAQDAGVALGAARTALQTLIRRGEVHHHDGPNRAHFHHAGPSCSTCPSEQTVTRSRSLRAVP